MLNRILHKLDKIAKLTEQELWDYAMQSTEVKSKIIDYIINQLNIGENADGKIIGTYSKTTEEITGGRKKQGDPYDLDDTGFFRNTISVRPNSNEIIIVADGKTGKSVDILDEYTIRVIELNKTNLSLLSDFIKNEYLIYVRKNILSHN